LAVGYAHARIYNAFLCHVTLPCACLDTVFWYLLSGELRSDWLRRKTWYHKIANKGAKKYKKRIISIKKLLLLHYAFHRTIRAIGLRLKIIKANILTSQIRSFTTADPFRTAKCVQNFTLSTYAAQAAFVCRSTTAENHRKLHIYRSEDRDGTVLIKS